MKFTKFILVLTAWLSFTHLFPVFGQTQQDLQEADAKLNKVYGAVMSELSEQEKIKLRDEQREWVRQRDAHLAKHPSDAYAVSSGRTDYLAQILTLQNKEKETNLRLQGANEELERNYKYLLGTLDVSQKEKLKNEQEGWLRRRDATTAANPRQQKEALGVANWQRTNELKNRLEKVSRPLEGTSAQLAD